MSLIDEVTQNYGIDPALIKALIRVESNFNSEATSKKGAQGLMQLMPHTAQRHQVKDPYDPKDNIEGGIKYLLQLIEAYDQDLDLALAAYNAGPPAVEKYQGVPPFAETQKFVRDIQSYQACFAQDGSGSRK